MNESAPVENANERTNVAQLFFDLLMEALKRRVPLTEVDGSAEKWFEASQSPNHTDLVRAHLAIRVTDNTLNARELFEQHILDMTKSILEAPGLRRIYVFTDSYRAFPGFLENDFFVHVTIYSEFHNTRSRVSPGAYAAQGSKW